jgi:hypothetical protein
LATQNWNNIKHKFSEKEHQAIKKEARAELRRLGFDKLRKARAKTQVEVASRLNIPQAAVSRMEQRTDVLLSTLREYIGALGGRLEMRAVFEDADFNLDELYEDKPGKVKLLKRPVDLDAGSGKSGVVRRLAATSARTTVRASRSRA